MKAKYVNFPFITQTADYCKRVGLEECSFGRPSDNHARMKSVGFHR